LNERQKEGFTRLGVFSQWFDVESASAICELDYVDAFGLLRALQDHSLLVGEIFGGKKHWRMLELIHAFAISRLDNTKREHVEYLRAGHFIQRLTQLPAIPAEKESFFQVNSNNLRSALQWAILARQTGLAYQLSGFLNEDYWEKHGFFREGLALLRSLLELPYVESPSLYASRLQMASDYAWQQHDFDVAIGYCREAAELGRFHGLKQEYPWYLNRLGRIYIEQVRYPEARQVLQEVLELSFQMPEIINPGIPLAQLGEVAFCEEKLDEAQELLKHALSYLANADQIFLAIALTDLAEIALASNEFEKSLTLLRQAFQPALNQARRLMVFLLALIGYLTLYPAGDKKEAAGFLGALHSLGESSGVILSQFHVDLNEKRSQLVREQLSPSDWNTQFTTGRQWNRDEILAKVGLVLHPQKDNLA
jgi:tetratricopeptide (TPR) repeat protein